MIPMTNKARAAAKSLAVEYLGAHEALTNGDDEGIVVWGGMLLRTQQEIGVEVYTDKWLRPIVERARRRLAEKRDGVIETFRAKVEAAA